jgi:hypothetical protein
MSPNVFDAVVKKAFDWSKINYTAQYDVDLTWSTSRGVRKGGLVDNISMGRIIDIISKTSDIETRSLRVVGTLVGIDSRSKRFRLVEKDGQDYVGTFGPSFPGLKKWAVNRNYIADLDVETIMYYATH